MFCASRQSLQRSICDEKCTVLPHSLLQRSPFSFCFFDSCHAGILFNFPTLFPLQPSHLVFNSCGIGKFYVLNGNGSMSLTLCSNVILVIFVRLIFIDSSASTIQTYLAGFTAAFCWCYARHCCWHRIFQLSTIVFHGVLTLWLRCWSCSLETWLVRRSSSLHRPLAFTVRTSTHALPWWCLLLALVFQESLMVPRSWPSLCVEFCETSDISFPGSFGRSYGSSPSMCAHGSGLVSPSLG